MARWNDKFEKAGRRHATFRLQEYPLHDRVLPRIIEDKARRYPNHVVFQFGEDSITFGELNDRINRVANGLLALGLRKGDKVAVMLPNCAEFVYAWFGLARIGAVEVPINTALKGFGLCYQINQSDSVAIIADAEHVERLQAIMEELSGVRHVVLLDRSGSEAPLPTVGKVTTLGFEDLIGHSSKTPDITVHYSDLATILYTSGTTGESKGVETSHHYWYHCWTEAVRFARFTDEDVLYTALPFFHGNAKGITVGPAILAPARAVVVERFSASRFLDDCRRWECTEAAYIGGMLPILLKQAPREDDADNPLRILVGGGARAKDWEPFQQRFNTKLIEMYGLSEVYICLASPFEATRVGSCGKPIVGWEVQVVDEDDQECKPGQQGEIICRPERGKMFISSTGYYRKPEASLELFRNGWVHSGDFGRMDEDGYFYFVDRKKQALRRRGENISSFEVEAVISSHPAVLESCVVGVPAEVGEEEVKAVIVLKPGCTLEPAEIILWCEPRLAYFAVPRYVAIRSSLPKTATERVQKFKLKEEGVTADCWDAEKVGLRARK